MFNLGEQLLDGCYQNCFKSMRDSARFNALFINPDFQALIFCIFNLFHASKDGAPFVCDHASTKPNGSDAVNPIKDPCQFLISLAENISEGIVIYTLDESGKFTFVSQSSAMVLNYPAQSLIDQHISTILTRSLCNDGMRANHWKLSSESKLIVGKLEIRNPRGDSSRLSYWQTTVYCSERPVGASGILQIDLPDETKTTVQEWTSQEVELMRRVGTLSPVERDVVQMAVDGHMNKSMASMLEVAVRTIESRRARAMLKLNAKSVSHLVQIWISVRSIEDRGYRIQ